MYSVATKHFGHDLTHGFTLTEMLVVVAILAILTSSSLFGLVNVSRRAAIVNAQSKMQKLGETYQLLALDTGGKMPGGIYTAVPNSCPSLDIELFLNNSCSGMLQNHPGTCADTRLNTGTYPNWNGPYVQSENDLMDQWGTPYYFDPDYRCHSYVDGCENVPNEQIVRAIVSFGPDKNGGYGPTGHHGAHGFIYNDQDNIVHVICQTPQNPG